MPIPNAILATIYALHVVMGLYMLLTHGLSILQAVFLALSAITILALTQRAGAWARTTALVYSGLMLIVGAASIVAGLWWAFRGEEGMYLALAVAAIFIPIPAWTIHALRRPAERAPDNSDAATRQNGEGGD